MKQCPCCGARLDEKRSHCPLCDTLLPDPKDQRIAQLEADNKQLQWSNVRLRLACEKAKIHIGKECDCMVNRLEHEDAHECKKCSLYKELSHALL
jgi:hypothetical protein